MIEPKLSLILSVIFIQGHTFYVNQAIIHALSYILVIKSIQSNGTTSFKVVVVVVVVIKASIVNCYRLTRLIVTMKLASNIVD